MTEDEREAARTAARELLVEHVCTAVRVALAESEYPQLVMRAAPMVLAGLSGSYALQLLRLRTLADGEIDGVLDLMAASMREHADPSLNPVPEGREEVQLARPVVEWLRGWWR